MRLPRHALCPRRNAQKRLARPRQHARVAPSQLAAAQGRLRQASRAPAHASRPDARRGSWGSPRDGASDAWARSAAHTRGSAAHVRARPGGPARRSRSDSSCSERYSQEHVNNLLLFQQHRPYNHESKPSKVHCKAGLGHPAGCTSCTSCHFCRCARPSPAAAACLLSLPLQAEDVRPEDHLLTLRQGLLVRQLPGDAGGPELGRSALRL